VDVVVALLLRLDIRSFQWIVMFFSATEPSCSRNVKFSVLSFAPLNLLFGLTLTTSGGTYKVIVKDGLVNVEVLIPPFGEVSVEYAVRVYVWGSRYLWFRENVFEVCGEANTMVLFVPSPHKTFILWIE
jgi:hypothetical protein